MNRKQIFRGIIEPWEPDEYKRIALVQTDGYKIDLIARINELILNFGTKVSVKYWLCNSEKNDEQIKEGAVKSILGIIDAEFSSYEFSYSEYTSEIDYETDFSVEGHNLLDELLSNKGKWLVFEIEFKRPGNSGEFRGHET